MQQKRVRRLEHRFQAGFNGLAVFDLDFGLSIFQTSEEELLEVGNLNNDLGRGLLSDFFEGGFEDRCAQVIVVLIERISVFNAFQYCEDVNYIKNPLDYSEIWKAIPKNPEPSKQILNYSPFENFLTHLFIMLSRVEK